jgi:hypothetical protein
MQVFRHKAGEVSEGDTSFLVLSYSCVWGIHHYIKNASVSIVNSVLCLKLMQVARFSSQIFYYYDKSGVIDMSRRRLL